MSGEAVKNGRLTWSLTLVTRNRTDMLPQTVHWALRQTRPPIEVVVVDSSDEARYAAGAAAVRREIEASGMAIDYVHEPAEPSLTRQRNRAIELAKGDIVFLIDDDALMHEDCAEKIMAVYERDIDEEVAGVQGTLTGPPGQPVRRAKASDWKFWLKLWLIDVFLYQDSELVFVPYDGGYRRGPAPDWLAEHEAIIKGVMHGCRMTYRRHVIADSRFEPIFYGNAPCEDQDASYRASRRGLLVQLPTAYLHHVFAPRVGQKRWSSRGLSQLDMYYLARKHSNNLRRDRVRLNWRLARYLVADSIRDLGKKRWALPRPRAQFRAWRDGRRLLRLSEDRVDSEFLAMRARYLAPLTNRKPA
ncbi:MAG: glycosyltransferase family 2 protein [Planctomycetota bacterium]